MKFYWLKLITIWYEDTKSIFKEIDVEEGPSRTYPDLENMRATIKKDKFMKEVYQSELGEDFQSMEDGVAIGEIRPVPMAAMSPFEPGPWPDKGEEDV